MLKSNRILRNQQLLIEQMRQTNELLHSLPEKLGATGASVVIEHLQVEQAHLDKLLFELDQVDVQELSGTLNIGTNFHLDDARNHVQKDSPGIIRQLFHGVDRAGARPEPDAPTRTSPEAGPPSADMAGSDTAANTATDESPGWPRASERHVAATTTGFVVHIGEVGSRAAQWKGDADHVDKPGAGD